MIKPETAQQVVDAIHGSYHTGSKNGFCNILALMNELDQNQKDLPAVPVIHVAGTNGKGSTCAMLERILRCAGLKTGLYTSPFLQAYQERVRINGIPLTDDLMLRYGAPLLEANEKLQQNGMYPTPFELGTALALSAFRGEQVDAAIIEVGLGGRMDPTNIVTPQLCVITAIGMDHMEFLGDTPEAIAAEKAGIIKEGVPVICQTADEDVAEVFRRVSDEKKAPLLQLTDAAIVRADCDAYGSTVTIRLHREWKDLRINLPGRHQLRNACTVLAAVEALQDQGFAISEEAVRQGLAAVRWPARLEWCGSILLDGAHNAQGIEALCCFVQEHLADRKRVVLTGVLGDKLTEQMLRGIASLGGETICVTPDNLRAMEAGELVKRFEGIGHPAKKADTLEEAIAAARSAAGQDGVVIACGSLYLMGSLRTALGLQWNA